LTILVTYYILRMLIINTKKMTKELTRDIIAMLIVIGMIVSLFFPVLGAGADMLRYAAAAVIGFYFGLGKMPVLGAIRKK